MPELSYRGATEEIRSIPSPSDFVLSGANGFIISTYGCRSLTLDLGLRSRLLLQVWLSFGRQRTKSNRSRHTSILIGCVSKRATTFFQIGQTIALEYFPKRKNWALNFINQFTTDIRYIKCNENTVADYYLESKYRSFIFREMTSRT